jgi:hypothetical protein
MKEDFFFEICYGISHTEMVISLNVHTSQLGDAVSGLSHVIPTLVSGVASFGSIF